MKKLTIETKGYKLNPEAINARVKNLFQLSQHIRELSHSNDKNRDKEIAKSQLINIQKAAQQLNDLLQSSKHTSLNNHFLEIHPYLKDQREDHNNWRANEIATMISTELQADTSKPIKARSDDLSEKILDHWKFNKIVTSNEIFNGLEFLIRRSTRLLEQIQDDLLPKEILLRLDHKKFIPLYHFVDFEFLFPTKIYRSKYADLRFLSLNLERTLVSALSTREIKDYLNKYIESYDIEPFQDDTQLDTLIRESLEYSRQFLDIS